VRPAIVLSTVKSKPPVPKNLSVEAPLSSHTRRARMIRQNHQWIQLGPASVPGLPSVSRRGLPSPGAAVKYRINTRLSRQRSRSRASRKQRYLKVRDPSLPKYCAMPGSIGESAGLTRNARYQFAQQSASY
jgi:hypothetical protein